MSIPAWSSEGVLPPVNSSDPTSPHRSPYPVALPDFIARFGDTVERRVVLDGLLRYRAELHRAGLVAGFQWVDGSFLERIELLESRAPNDLDVVTFYRLPAGKSQQDLLQQAPELFGLTADAIDAIRTAFHVDGYVVDLGTTPERLTRQSTYWYSMWSHRRDRTWKGFVQIDLAPTNEAAATSILATLNASGARP